MFKNLKDSVCLAECSKGRDNNLDVMRFVAALMVIFCHAYPISMGAGFVDPVGVLTNGVIHAGGLAVSLFFIFGGFLIAKSMERVKEGKQYFKARCFRIFPSLIFVTLVVAFVMGALLTTLPLAEYYTDKQTYLYLFNAVFVPVHDLPGVFSNNAYGPVVNGSLWTLSVEFACYVLCFLFYKFKFFNKKRFIVSIPIFIVGCVTYWFVIRQPLLREVIRPTALFYVGVGAYVFRDDLYLNKRIAGILSILLAFTFIFGMANLGMLVFFPYIVFTMAFATKRKLSGFSKYGEFSYGVYLWGFPIQQLVCYLYGGGMNVFLNMAVSIPMVILLGMATHFVVEKPFLRKSYPLQKKIGEGYEAEKNISDWGERLYR